MGAPKQKWTPEEEAALLEGVDKYGAGKWSEILRDPDLRVKLATRSNVDLKDKWRNINVTAQGCGSRERARMAFKKSSQLAKQNKQLHEVLITNAFERSDTLLDSKHKSCHSPISPRPDCLPRLENLILEAVSNLNRGLGCNKSAIQAYVKENFKMNPGVKKLISSVLKSLIENGRLVEAPGRCYRIAEIPGNSSSTGLIPKSSHVLCLPAICHSKQHSVPSFDSLRCPGDELKFNFDNEFNSSVGDEIEKHVNNLMNMNAEDASKAAADAAAKAVQEAEMLIAEAEEAFMEAEQAKEEYEAAKAYLATKNKRYRNSGKRHFDE